MRISKNTIRIIICSSILLLSGVVGMAAETTTTQPAAAIERPKFVNFDPADYSGATGKIVLPCAGNQAYVTLRKLVDGKQTDYLQLRGTSNELTAPIGKYAISSYQISIPEKSGSKWSISSYRAGTEGASQIEIKAGESTAIDPNTKLKAAVESGKTGTIKLPCDCDASVSLTYLTAGNPEGNFSVYGKGKSLVVPAGKYRLGYFFLSVTSPDKSRWTINGNSLFNDKTGRLIEVKPGASLNLLADGKLAASLKSGKSGTIVLPFEGQAWIRMQSASDPKGNETLSLNGKTSKFSVPAGDYQMLSTSCTMADKDNVNWSVSWTPTSKALSVKPGGEVKIGFTEPLTSSIDVKQDGDKYTLSLKTVSADGTQVNVRRADGKGEAPGFQVLSKSGDVLASGKFQYG